MAEMAPVFESPVIFWIKRFSDSFQMLQRRYRPKYSRIWLVDEFHVRLRDGRGYVYVVVEPVLQTDGVPVHLPVHHPFGYLSHQPLHKVVGVGYAYLLNDQPSEC